MRRRDETVRVVLPAHYTDDLPQYMPTVPPVMTDKDVEESVRIGRVIVVTAKECYFNARRVVGRAGYATASYCEGYAVVKSRFLVVIEHGWVVRDGRVIDPTMPEHDMVYFAGLEWRGRGAVPEFYRLAGRKYRSQALFHAWGWGGSGSRSFLAARQRAQDEVSRILGGGGRGLDAHGWQ